MAFVSFKDKDCVNETIEEIDIVKTKLVGKEHYDALDIKNWEVEQAMPTSDIIWPEINRGKSRPFVVKLILALIPFAVSGAFVAAVMYVDRQLGIPEYFVIFCKYCSPMCLLLFAFYALPYIIYKIVQQERHERKSEKEESFMRKNMLLMIFNLLVLPAVISAVITYARDEVDMVKVTPNIPKFPKNIIVNEYTYKGLLINATFSSLTKLYSGRLDYELTEFIAKSLSNCQEFFTRYLLQIILLMIVFQMYVPPERIMKAFHQILTSGGKTKFKVSLSRPNNVFRSTGCTTSASRTPSR